VRGQQVDHRLLHAAHQLADAVAAPPEVDQHVGHHLPGAVVGDLAAAVDGHDRNVGNGKKMFALACLAEGEYRRMFQHP
jgi:uncharacterized protein YcfJ